MTLGLIVLGLALSGCPKKQSIIAISVTPASVALRAGESCAFKVMAVDASGAQRDVTALAALTLSVPALGTVASNGSFTAGNSALTGMLFAAYEGYTASALISIYTGTGVLQIESLTLSPASASVQAYESLAYAVTAVLSDGSVYTVTESSSFYVEPADLGTVSPEGIFLAARANATGRVVASYEGYQAAAAVTVQGDALNYLRVEPIPPVANVVTGGQVAFRLRCVLADGSVQTRLPTDASVEPPSLGTLTGGVFVAGSSPGTGLVRLSVNSYSTTAVVHVITTAGQTQDLSFRFGRTPVLFAENFLEFSLWASLGSGTTAEVTGQASYQLVPETLGSVDIPGFFSAGASAGTGLLLASYSSRTIQAAIQVLAPPLSFALSTDTGETAFAANTPFTVYVSLVNNGTLAVRVAEAVAALQADTAHVAFAIDTAFVPEGATGFSWSGETAVWDDVVQLQGMSDSQEAFLTLAPGATARFARLFATLKATTSVTWYDGLYMAAWDDQGRFVLDRLRTTNAPGWFVAR